MRWRLSISGLTIAALLIASIRLALSADLIGQASIIDGDTLEIHGTRIRLWGIDAPESSQLCRGDDSLPYRCSANVASALVAPRSMQPVNIARHIAASVFH